MINRDLIIFLVIIFLIVFVDMFFNKRTIEGLSNEAIQNIASIYNKDNMIVTNLITTREAKFKPGKGVDGSLSTHFPWPGDNRNYIRGETQIDGSLVLNGSFNLLPRGVIVAWTGTQAPAGWALCNGQNGTPDLRGRFIYGFGGGQGAIINKRGGAETHTLNINEMPKHNHSTRHWADDGGYCKNLPCGFQASDRNTSDARQDQPTNYVGGNQPHNNMPPYHVLAYIMKL